MRSLARQNSGFVWSGSAESWSEAQKLASLHPAFRKKIEAVLQDMRSEGRDAKVFFGWRSQQRQAELVKAGRSKVSFSFHNAMVDASTPAALAVDIVSQSKGWNDMDFFHALGRIGKKHGLYWGGDWRSFRDYAHLQAAPNSALSVLRDRGLAAIGFTTSAVGRSYQAYKPYYWLGGASLFVGIIGVALAARRRRAQ
jgi:peptidoglycan L-alanyl-D-glutamate endopeptidase CwlK